MSPDTGFELRKVDFLAKQNKSSCRERIKSEKAACCYSEKKLAVTMKRANKYVNLAGMTVQRSLTLRMSTCKKVLSRLSRISGKNP